MPKGTLLKTLTAVTLCKFFTCTKNLLPVKYKKRKKKKSVGKDFLLRLGKSFGQICCGLLVVIIVRASVVTQRSSNVA